VGCRNVPVVSTSFLSFDGADDHNDGGGVIAVAVRGQGTETDGDGTSLLRFRRPSSAFYSSARVWDDGVVAPCDTRRVLSAALSICVASQRRAVVDASLEAAAPWRTGVYRF
jgi:hypothetical protein